MAVQYSTDSGKEILTDFLESHGYYIFAENKVDYNNSHLLFAKNQTLFSMKPSQTNL